MQDEIFEICNDGSSERVPAKILLTTATRPISSEMDDPGNQLTGASQLGREPFTNNQITETTPDAANRQNQVVWQTKIEDFMEDAMVTEVTPPQSMMHDSALQQSARPVLDALPISST